MKIIHKLKQKYKTTTIRDERKYSCFFVLHYDLLIRQCCTLYTVIHGLMTASCIRYSVFLVSSYLAFSNLDFFLSNHHENFMFNNEFASSLHWILSI